MRVILDALEPESNEVQIDRSDLIDLDLTLACVIAPALSLFLKQDHSYPDPIDDEDLPTELSSSSSKDKWDWMLGEMIFAFTSIKNEPVRSEDVDRVDRGLRLFAKWYRHLWV